MTAVAWAALALLAQASGPDAEIRQRLKARAAELERDFLPKVDAAGFERMRPELRRRYFSMLGLDPMPERTPLQAKITGTIDEPDFRVEKLHFQSRPGLYVTANLYLPRTPGPHPAILYACGHSNMKRDGNKSAYQDHGIWYATHGYVCLVYDTLQLGEIAAVHHGTYREQRWFWHSLGYTSAGVECWNAIRALDYLETRPEVDKGRIGATGISGGGAATFWIAAADERIKAAVPVSGMADLGYYVGEDGVNGHCDCMFLHNSERWNWTVIAALVAPRPLLFSNSDDDKIFPMSANERAVARLEHLYARFGASDLVDACVSIGGHAYRTDLRRMGFEWMNRHLKGDARPVTDADAGLARKFPPARLRVFETDADLPADALNARIDETFVATVRPALPAPAAYPAWRDGLLASIRRIILEPSLPGDPPAALDASTLVVLGAGEPASPDWAAPHLGGAAAFAPDGRLWARKNPPNTIERSLVLLGDTRDALRTRDLLAQAAKAKRIVGRGQDGILAAYAALFLPGIEEVVLVDPPASHRQGPHYLGILRVLDLPDALGLLAPRKLTLVGAADPAFDRTAEIYRIAGAADRFGRR